MVGATASQHASVRAECNAEHGSGVAEMLDAEVAYSSPEQARSQLFAGFALLAVVVACLGLFGLAAFTAERRTKEIGIRKVFGARTRDIVRLLAWQFSKPVIVANLIAWPVAWWAMRDWLNEFDSRIALGPGPFVVAGLVALLIAAATIACMRASSAGVGGASSCSTYSPASPVFLTTQNVSSSRTRSSTSGV